MKLTNKLGLEPAIVEAVKNSGYNRGSSDYTATQLIEPPRIGALKEKHSDEIEEDVSDMIFSLIGQAEHTILERAAKALTSEGYVVEHRYFAEIQGKKISAQVDLYHPGKKLLQDYKVTSVYSVKGDHKREWEEQLNIQAFLIGENIERLQIVAILRDWSKMEYARELMKNTETNYPAQQIVIVDIPIWTKEETLAFLLHRIELHNQARTAKLPECSSDERWERSSKYALMKKGRKSALRLFDTKEAAQLALVDLNSNDVYIERRPGVSIRCENYCPVAKFCTQYQKTKKET